MHAKQKVDRVTTMSDAWLPARWLAAHAARAERYEELARAARVGDLELVADIISGEQNPRASS